MTSSIATVVADDWLPVLVPTYSATYASAEFMYPTDGERRSDRLPSIHAGETVDDTTVQKVDTKGGIASGLEGVLETDVFYLLSNWLDELDAACRNAATPNWDGESAAPVQEGARRYVIHCMLALLSRKSFPEVSVDPDGEICLDWDDGDGVFSVSISDQGRLSYAGLRGASECHGTECIVNKQVLAEVAQRLVHHMDRLVLA